LCLQDRETWLEVKAGGIKTKAPMSVSEEEEITFAPTYRFERLTRDKYAYTKQKATGVSPQGQLSFPVSPPLLPISLLLGLFPESEKHPQSLDCNINKKIKRKNTKIN
jgi:hypothetical protein